MTDFCGEIVAVDRDLDTVTLEDRRRSRRTFPLGPGFLLEGRPVILVGRRAQAGTGEADPHRLRLGRRPRARKARVARASRIFVEGRHDAELVEKVWGDDLRVEGVVVEYLGGVDDLAEHLRDFRPGPDRRVGVLVDHLVPGSKESRIAAGIARSAVGKHVLVVGHPFIDIWQAVKPRPARHRGVARGPPRPWTGSTAPASCSAGRTATRPTSPGPGSTSWPASVATRPRPGPAGPGRGAHRLRDDHDPALRGRVGLPIVRGGGGPLAFSARCRGRGAAAHLPVGRQHVARRRPRGCRR